MGRASRGQARMPWDGDVRLNFDALVSRCHVVVDLLTASGGRSWITPSSTRHRDTDGGSPCDYDRAPV